MHNSNTFSVKTSADLSTIKIVLSSYWQGHITCNALNSSFSSQIIPELSPQRYSMHSEYPNSTQHTPQGMWHQLYIKHPSHAAPPWLTQTFPLTSMDFGSDPKYSLNIFFSKSLQQWGYRLSSFSQPEAPGLQAQFLVLWHAPTVHRFSLSAGMGGGKAGAGREENLHLILSL